MAKVILKQTSNPKFRNLIGIEGDLSVEADNRFHFRFLDSDENAKDLTSGVVEQLGDLNNPIDKNISIQTKNSTYYFEKSERVRDRLFSHHNNSLEQNIISAEEKSAVKKALDSVYGSLLRNNKTDYSR